MGCFQEENAFVSVCSDLDSPSNDSKKLLTGFFVGVPGFLKGVAVGFIGTAIG